MNDTQRKETMRSALEMYESLQTAIHTAGGSMLSVRSLERMTVMEFFAHVATNNIRFHYEPEAA